MQSPYLLIPISLIVLSAYLLSHVFVRFEIISRRTHRRFWNIALLITFLVAGILGLLLTIQINYKLEWTLINKFLNWHVNFGIAMALVAFFHFLWHIDYYLKLFRRPEKKASRETEMPEVSREQDKKQGWLIGFLGFYTTVVQVILIRELTTVFQGNEIMMTWTLGIWMILTGIGSLLGRRVIAKMINTPNLRYFMIWLAVAPLLMVIALSLIKDLLFPPGMLVSPWQYLLLIFYLLAPICIFSGLLFTCFIRTGNYRFNRVYILEALGSILGGILVSFILLEWFTVLQSLVFVAFLASVILYVHSLKPVYSFIILLTAGWLLVMFFLPGLSIEEKLHKKSFGNTHVVENVETHLGNITVTEQWGEYNYFLNGSLLFNTDEFALAEEYVHFALFQHPHPERVLLVSGGYMGMVDEILKYPDIARIDYVELNKKLLDLAEKRHPLADTPVLHVYPSDILDFLRETRQKFDIAILSVPDPSSIQLNRYYTDEFVGQLKKYLRKDAVIIYGLSSTGNYMSRWQKMKLSLIFNTLKQHFTEVIIIPGEKDYFIASDQKLSTSVARLSQKYELQNLYVNSDYFDDDDLRRRSLFITEQMDESVGVNIQHKALPAFYSSLKFLSKTSSSLPFLIIPLILLPLILILLPRGTKGMYLAGMSGASIEVMIIFMVQIAFGYIYAVLGILIAVFMAGLVLGAEATRYIAVSIRTYRLAFVGMILFLLILFGFLHTPYIGFSRILLWIIFIFFMLIPSAITGFVFVGASRLFHGDEVETSPRMYAADLIGAALGITSMTLILIPLAGLPFACLILLVLNIIPVFSRRKII